MNNVFCASKWLTSSGQVIWGMLSNWKDSAISTAVFTNHCLGTKYTTWSHSSGSSFSMYLHSNRTMNVLPLPGSNWAKVLRLTLVLSRRSCKHRVATQAWKG